MNSTGNKLEMDNILNSKAAISTQRTFIIKRVGQQNRVAKLFTTFFRDRT